MRDAINRVGIPKNKQKQFSKWLHKEKELDFMRGDDNYEWDDLLEKANDFKKEFCR